MKLTITTHQGKREIPLDRIEFLSASGNYTRVHILGEKPLLISRTLSVVAIQLPDFLRIHKQTLINPDHVVACQLRKYRASTVSLSGHRELAVSRRKTQLVYDRLGKTD